MDAYQELKNRFAEIRHVQDAGSILDRDMITVMPRGSAADRTHQQVALARIAHEKKTDPLVGAWLDEAEARAANLPEWDRANLLMMRRIYTHATALTAGLAAEQARLASLGNQKHAQWRRSGDWADYRPHLEQIFSIQRDAAQAKQEALGTDTAYDALIDEYDPYSKAAVIEKLFAPVEAFLTEAIPDAAADAQARKLSGPYPLAGQEKLYRKIVTDMAFNFDKGRMYMVEQHPSCGGTPDDVRFTTRCNESGFLEGLRAVIHEAGHGLYEQNLPVDWRYQPVGNSVGMTIHESQSLFWEQQIAGHPNFFHYLAPLVREAFGFADDDEAHMPHSLLACGNGVAPSFIRVEADEMTYPMHVFLRFDLERRLMEGSLAVADIPEAWNEGMRARLGIIPPDHAKGCMQDIHWSQGAIGYFPSYTLGAMVAAQLFAVLEKDLPDVAACIEKGDLQPILAWLTAKIHTQGCLYSPMALVEKATGEPLNPDYFIAHLQQRFLSVQGQDKGAAVR